MSGSIHTDTMQLLSNVMTRLLAGTPREKQKALDDLESLDIPDVTREAAMRAYKEVIDAGLPDAIAEHVNERHAIQYSERNRLPAVTIETLLSKHFSQAEYVIDPILEIGSSANIWAFRGVGKTYLALALASSVAAGSDFLRWRIPRPRKVVYVDGELGQRKLQRRAGLITAGLDGQIDPGRFILISADEKTRALPNLSTKEGQQIIEEYFTDAGLIVLDSISTLFRSGKENDSDSWERPKEWILSLCWGGRSVLMLQHSRKDQESSRGHSNREDIGDTVIALRNPEGYAPAEGCRFTVRYTKNRDFTGDDAESFEAQMMSENGAAIWLMDKTPDPPSSIAEGATRLFEAGHSVSEVAKMLNISRSVAGRIRQKVAKK